MSKAGSSVAAAGFSLLEMLIALVVISLAMSGLGAVFAGTQERRSLAYAEERIDEGISRARTGARQTGFPHFVVFDIRRLAVVSRGEVWTKDIPVGVAISVVAAQEMKLGGKPAIAFFGDGSSSGGRVDLQSGLQMTTRSIQWLHGGRRES